MSSGLPSLSHDPVITPPCPLLHLALSMLLPYVHCLSPPCGGGLVPPPSLLTALYFCPISCLGVGMACSSLLLCCILAAINLLINQSINEKQTRPGSSRWPRALRLQPCVSREVVRIGSNPVRCL